MQRVFSKQKKGQSTMEQAILLIIIIGVFVAIQNYIKRGIQGRFKKAADNMGEQFSPGNVDQRKVENFKSRTRDTYVKGQTNSILLDDEVSTTSSDMEVVDLTWEFWGN